MVEFGHLSVLLSIILGLAITQLLQGWRGRMLHRARVVDYWPTHAWAAVLLLICTQFWWAMYGLRGRDDWSFAQFAIVLAQTILIYLVTALVYPDFTGGETIDLRTHYFTQRVHFFGLLAATALASILRDFILFGGPSGRINLAFLSIYFVTAVIGAATARAWFHKGGVVFIAGLFLVYILSLFSHLQ